MKKALKIIALLLALGLAFLAGWRVMPRVWPTIKTSVVYPLFPDLQPTPSPAAVPYTPQSNASLGDPVSAADSLVYYFYKDYCPYCANLEPLTSGLPAQLTLPDGTVSPVRLVCINKNTDEGAAVIDAFYTAHEIPEEERYVPAMVVGERYLMPGNEIIEQLMDALTAGEGLLTPVLGGAERIP